MAFWLSSLILLGVYAGVWHAEVEGHLECWPYMCTYHVCTHYVHVYTIISANVPGRDRGYSGLVSGVYWANHRNFSWPSRDVL